MVRSGFAAVAGRLLAGLFWLAGAAAWGAETAPQAADAAPGDTQTAEVRAAIQKGLSYLAGRQTPEGAWQSEHWRHGVSGLALLAFLGERGRAPAFQAAVDRGLGFLRKAYVAPGTHRDDPHQEDLYAGSLIAEDTTNAFLYEQAIAVLAMAEYVRENPGDDAARRMMTEGAKLLARSQASAARPQSLGGPIDPGQPIFGGWRYKPDSRESDLSASGWCISALTAAKAAGFPLPDQVYKDFAVYLRKCFDEPSNAFGYEPGGKGITFTTNAVGVLATIMCDRESPFLGKAMATLRQNAPTWGAEGGPGRWPFYCWYYTTRALYVAGGQDWARWEAAIRPMLLRNQNSDGSWDVAQREGQLGKDYGTAVAILILHLCSGRAPEYVQQVKEPRRTEWPVYTGWPFDAPEAKQRQAQTAQAAKVATEEAVDFGSAGKMKLLLLPAGEFLMGSPLDDKALKERWPNAAAGADRDDLPRHRVRLTKPFYVAQTEVTRAQFGLFAKEASYKTDAERQGRAYGLKDGKWTLTNALSWRDPGFPQTDADPAVCVSWNDAQAFCEWLSKKEGKRFFLLSEAQWEYACRAGSDALWPWGNREEDAQGKANVQGEDEGWEFFFKGVRDGHKLAPAPVAAYEANAFGLNDMIGNVTEWCRDWYGPRYYAESPASDPPGPPDPKDSDDPTDPTKPKRLARGGSWGSLPWRTTASSRFPFLPELGQTHTGFRVARGLDDALEPLRPLVIADARAWAAGAQKLPDLGTPGTLAVGPVEPARVATHTPVSPARVATSTPVLPALPVTSTPAGTARANTATPAAAPLPTGRTPGHVDGVEIPVMPKGVQEMFIVLTWDKKGDVDLHVTEPDGQRCYYGRKKTRTGGTLDNDDTKGIGPETYRPGIQRPGGPYKVEVCYFADRHRHRQPVKATVKVYSHFQGADQACVGQYEIELPRPASGRRYPVITVDLPGVTPHDPGPGVTTIRGDPRPPAK